MLFDRLSGEAMLKMATILHHTCRSVDLAAVALDAYDRQHATELQPVYMKRLSGG
jgi:hypothetical protein